MAELTASRRTPSDAAPALTEDTDLRALLTALLDDRTESGRPDAKADVAPQLEIDRRLEFAASHPKSTGHPKRRRQQTGRPASLHDSLKNRLASRPTSTGPSLAEIDAFLDARARGTGTPAWNSFAPEPPVVRRSTGLLAGTGGAAARRSASRPALVAAGLGLCMMAVWLVLR